MAMNAIVKFILNFFIFLYLVFEPLIFTVIPKRYKELKNEIVLITGGGMGIGRLLAIKLSEFGCCVVVLDVNKDAGQNTVKLISDKGGRAYFYLCDVGESKSVYATAKKVKEDVGTVSILINNAGVVTGKLLLDCPDRLIEKTFRVNTLAHFWTCKAFLPDMISNNHGQIVNIASLAAYSGICGLSDYCSSKSAAVTFHESLYMELKKNKCTGIKTTLVCTWHIDTNMFRGAQQRFIPPLKANYVADRITSAIRREEEVTFIPWCFKLFLPIRSVIPLSAMTKLFEMCDAFNVMDNFIGHNQHVTAEISVGTVAKAANHFNSN